MITRTEKLLILIILTLFSWLIILYPVIHFLNSGAPS